MDFATALSVVGTIFAALECKELREMCSMRGYESQLKELQSTVETVKAVLLDAESRQENLTNQQQLWIQELNDAVYDADDLLDEFVTVAERKHKKLLQEDGQGKVAKKVRLLFSRLKDLGFAHKMSNGVKEVRKKLDTIASNHNQFGFKFDPQPIRKRKEETCSYVSELDIVGRKEDTEKIVGWLLDSEVDQRNVSFLTIVGIGGLGKTTLAQLVYNDERVAKHFNLKLWACVSDEDPKHLNLQGVLAKILGSKTNHNNYGSTMEELQGQVRQLLAGKRYLLILDDVWNENRDEWLKLVQFFRGDQRGSWVVVTTRSKMTAQVVDGLTHDLQGLSDEDSWHLFTKIAFGQGEDVSDLGNLKEIGQKIVQKCANVPLAIRVVGSLLYGQDKNKWLDFQKKGLKEIKPNDNGIWPVLKLSYDQLESPLKSCFGYCALFSKDFRMTKEELINLWMAQGYIIPLEEGQEVEDVVEEYFSTLLRRCFLQISEEDEYVCTYTMHDLMHDLAQEVARNEVCYVTSSTSKLGERTRHVLILSNDFSKARSLSKIRSFSLPKHLLEMIELPIDKLLIKWMCLRMLELRYTTAKSLPDTIGKLVHLRYLNLSDNFELEVLPSSITKLYNLQTLLLRNCYNLKELPNDLSKLVKLRALDTTNCYKLTHMPLGMSKLSCLRMLSNFAVGEASSRCGMRRQGVVHQLEDLKALTNLKGCLSIRIKIPRNASTYVRKSSSTSGGGYLSNKQHLEEMESLGEAWELFRSSLSSLRILYILQCDKLRSLSEGGGLQHLTALKSLEISDCPNLSLEEEEEEVTEEEKSLPMTWQSLSHSLRYLTLVSLPKLVKLPKEMQFLTSLHSLEIEDCKSLESMPEWMPKLTSLTRLDICECSDRLSQRCQGPAGEDWPYIRHIPHVYLW